MIFHFQIKSTKPLQEEEEHYLRRITILDLTAKCFSLTLLLAFLLFTGYAFFIRVFSPVSPWYSESIAAFSARIHWAVTLSVFLVNLIISGSLIIFWRPLKAGYTVETVTGTVSKEGRALSLEQTPLLTPPPWRKYIPLNTPVTVKVAVLNGINMGKRGAHLLAVPSLELDYARHAKLGLLKYRSTGFPGFMMYFLCAGLLLTWITNENILRSAYYKGLLTSPLSWLAADLIHGILAVEILLLCWAAGTFFFYIIRNLMIRRRIDKDTVLETGI